MSTRSCEVHSDSSCLESVSLAGSSLHTKIAGSSCLLVILSCRWILGGTRRQLAAFWAGCDGAELAGVAAVAVVLCQCIAGARLLPVVMQPGLSPAAPAVLILAVVVVGVVLPPAAAAAAVVVAAAAEVVVVS